MKKTNSIGSPAFLLPYSSLQCLFSPLTPPPAQKTTKPTSDLLPLFFFFFLPLLRLSSAGLAAPFLRRGSPSKPTRRPSLITHTGRSAGQR